MFSTQKTCYNGHVDECNMELLAETHSRDTEGRLQSRRCTAAAWFIAVSLVLHALFIVIRISCVNSPTQTATAPNHALRQVSSYCKWLCKMEIGARLTLSAPAFDEVEIHLETVRMNGTLFPGASPHWSRLEPSKLTDAYWEIYEDMPPFVITKEDVIRLGKDPETAVRFDNEYWGFGEEAYMATLDIQHQIHCLNALRTMAFADYGEDTPTKKSHNKLWWIHLRHCTDMLLQNLMCTAEPSVFTYNYMDTQRNPFPDFSIDRKCRRFEDIWQWRNERVVDMEQLQQAPVPKPEKLSQIIPAEDEYYQMFGYEDSVLFPELAQRGP
jgi:hypothetical protein